MSSSSIQGDQSNLLSSELSFETQSEDPFLTPPPPCNLIGYSSQFYQWTRDHHSHFCDWWVEQSWTLTAIVDLSTNSATLRKKLNWDSTARKSSVWTQFDQAANRKTGEPVLVCCKCSESISHPNVKGSGTSALGKHLVSI